MNVQTFSFFPIRREEDEEPIIALFNSVSFINDFNWDWIVRMDSGSIFWWTLFDAADDDSEDSIVDKECDKLSAYVQN